MTYSITYRNNNETINLEWIVPTGWSTTEIRKSFEQQYPQAELIKIEALQ